MPDSMKHLPWVNDWIARRPLVGTHIEIHKWGWAAIHRRGITPERMLFWERYIDEHPDVDAIWPELDACKLLQQTLARTPASDGESLELALVGLGWTKQWRDRCRKVYCRPRPEGWQEEELEDTPE